jgi:pimeloyl-ACP methyl ester carboxylesterase
VLLHGYWATLTMWSLNVEDLSRNHRVYAIDVMGQPGRNTPSEPIRTAADYVEWLTATLDGLCLDQVSLMGMSYGAWLSLSYAVAQPGRIRKLVLLSPAASLVPLSRQFAWRAMVMLVWPARFTVRWFMRWLAAKHHPGDAAVRRVTDTVVDLMWLGLKHYRFQPETLRVIPTVFTDDELREMMVPTLLLIGEREVIYDPRRALARADRFILGLEGELVPNTSHDMALVEHARVDARILEFLDGTWHDLARKAS